MPLKNDAKAIRQALGERNAFLNLGARDWWKSYAFHFTDVLNAVGVLTKERLYSRGTAVRQQLMVVENADRTVVARRQEDTDRFVRLYFRPRTPTQFRNEGVRPIGDRPAHGAHCPVPVFFLFDLEELLLLEGTLFTDCAAFFEEAIPRGSARALRKMPWRDIYSVGAIPADSRHLIGARMAEILIDHPVSLKLLRTVICRSGPERDTLLYRLPSDARTKWRKKVRLAGRAELYERRWTFLEEVRWGGDFLLFSFSPIAAEFDTHVQVTDVDTGTVCIDKRRPWTFGPNTSVFRAQLPSEVRRVEILVTLDDSVVYNAALSRAELLTR
jgi:hypothetical protein